MAVIEHTPDSLRFVDVSAGFLAAFDLTRPAAAGREVKDVLPCHVALPLAGAVGRALARGQSVTFEAQGRKTSGPAPRYQVTVRALGGDGKRVILEASRLEPRRAFRGGMEGLFDQLNQINGGTITVYDLTKPIEFNLNHLLDYPRDHPASTSFTALDLLVHPDDMPRVLAHRTAIEKLPDGEFQTMTIRMKHLDGGWRWIAIREQVFSRGRDGTVRRVLSFASDVSERRRLTTSLAWMSKALLEAEQHERRRIGRELHDSTAQHLVAIDLTLSLLERRPNRDPAYRRILQDLRSALMAAHRDIRTFSYLLHPPELERAGLEKTLRRFVEGFGTRTGLQIELDIQPGMPPVGSMGELALFRVAQEALMNAHKHAGAHKVLVRLSAVDAAAVLEVADDGIGLSEMEIHALLAEDLGGVGVAGMRARMQEMGGAMQILPQSRGLLIRATLPTTWTSAATAVA